VVSSFRVITEAPEVNPKDLWPEPDMRLVEDDRPFAPELEEKALPAGWWHWVCAEAEARGCPPDYLAAGLITSASALLGNARWARAIETWAEPPNLWTVLIGPPSIGKTPGLRPFVDGCRTIERNEMTAWQQANARHQTLVEKARLKEEEWKEQVKQAVKGKKSEPPARPVEADAPNPPPMPRVLAMDATTEELQNLLVERVRGLLYMRNELSGWLGNHDRYGGKGGDRAFYLECWDGGSYVVDRVKNHDKPRRIERATLSILGGLQPDKLKEALSGPDDGLAARLSYIWPNPVSIKSLTSEPDHEAQYRREMLIVAMRRLHGLEMSADLDGQPAPKSVPLDREALALFDQMRMESMERARSTRGLAAGWHGKTGRALRLALTFQMLGWTTTGVSAEPGVIEADTMVRAGLYLDYLGAMFDRVTAGLAVGQAEADAAIIARHILAEGLTTLNERALYRQSGWAWLRASERRAEALEVLVKARWLRPPAARPGQGRPAGDWEVSPKLQAAAQ
jgi:hypothetical protein